MILHLKRFLARFFDYGLFYFSVVFGSMILPIELEDKVLFLLTLLTPFLFAPFEAITLKKWGTTLGKKLFGLSFRSLTWKESFKRAFWWGLRPGTIESRPIPLWRYLLALMFACSGGSALFLGQDIREVAIQYEQKVAGKGWIKYASEDGKFVAHFPKKPQVVSKTFDVPDGNPLNLSEYRVEKEAGFSVSYLDLPQKWRIFSSNTLLKGAMNVVIQHMPGTQLLEKTLVKHKNYPAMDFKMKEGENLIEGRLILVGNTLYKLMVIYYPKTPRELQHEIFVSSFELKE